MGPGKSDAPTRRSIPAMHVVAVVLGNGLEFYDFLSYAIFAVYIGKTFFPAHDPSINLIFSVATFGIGFVTRPVGGIVLGMLGDRAGRKPAMIISFVLMGLGMLGVALTPGYAQIGIAAPILLVCFRLVQGFALGGEIGPNTAYLIEAAPPERRGFYGAMQFASQDASTLVASSVALALTSLLTQHDLEAWGWRLAFLLGVVIVPFGILLRRTLPETLHAADDAALAPDATSGSLQADRRIRPYVKLIIAGFALFASFTIGAYIIDYMTSFALNTLHFSTPAAFGVTFVTSLTAVFFDCTSGILSDRFGRRAVMIVPGAILLLLVVPAFWVITRYPSALTLYAMMGTLQIVFSLTSTPGTIAVTESLPRHIRSGVVSTVYAFAIAIFGGSTQFAVSSLIRLTGNPMMPAFYWVGAIVLGVLAAMAMPESAPAKTRALAGATRSL
ncbi:MAG TPA: MFS transporter [Rhizomicrobium sp.]|jgi:MFS family permease